MKHVLFIPLFLLVAIAGQLYAQKPSTFLFPEFVKGTVVMKNGGKTVALLNYDASNRKMMFKQDNDLLILTNIASVDTIYIDKRKFFPIRNLLFLESVACEHGTVYINWSLRNKYQGQKGAYGQVSQAANVEQINTSYWTNNGYEKESLDVYERENNNEYWLKLNDKFVNCKNKKALLKLFPNQRVKIEEYIKENNIDFSKTTQVLSLLDYCMALE